MSPVSSPVQVDVARAEQTITITWDDGLVSRYPFEDLRVHCPCAECRGRRERNLPVWPKPASPQPLDVTEAETVGHWGLSVVWNDGHSTGIFTWDGLRAWAGDGGSPG